MHQSPARTYPFDPSYSAQDPSPEDGTQYPTSTPPYHQEFSQQQGSSHYYVQGDADDGTSCRLIYTCLVLK
jgi:hypothetical protein